MIAPVFRSITTNSPAFVVTAMNDFEDGKRYAREEHESGFTAILRAHVDATPGALGATLVDSEGPGGKPITELLT